MNIRLNGSTTIAMVVFLISTSMASLLGYRQYERVGAEEVLVANDLIAGVRSSPLRCWNSR
ncbi:hypothetical protein ACU8V3_03020 [Cobetia marina]